MFGVTDDLRGDEGDDEDDEGEEEEVFVSALGSAPHSSHL